MTMGATRRISIAWKGAEPSEPTDTMVLTSLDKHYVDIRLDKETGNLEWGFCGRAQSTGSVTAYSHEFDSRGYTDSDQGNFTVLSNGDLKEDGEMLNPATGAIEPYIEIWRPLDAGPGDIRVLQSSHGKIVRVGRWLQAIWLEGESIKYVRAKIDSDADETWRVVSGTPIDFSILDGSSTDWIVVE